MKSIMIFVFAFVLLCGANALPTIISSGADAVDCLNGVSCAPSQTCMSNRTGAGMRYSCSPLPNAVRCMDARFSCPASTVCAQEIKCVASDGTVTDGILNVDAFRVAKFRDFGAGMQPMDNSICGAIATHFKLPSFCQCSGAPLGGSLSCEIGLGNIISIGASGFIYPCGSPASLGYKAWVQFLGMGKSVGKTWYAQFSTNMNIPGATIGLPLVSANARAEIRGEVSGGVAAVQLDIGACGCVGVWKFKKCWCNPTDWLPVNVYAGSYDFSNLCANRPNPSPNDPAPPPSPNDPAPPPEDPEDPEFPEDPEDP